MKPARHDPPGWQSLSVIVICISVAVIDSVAITVALPAIAEDLRVSQAAAIWVVNLHQIAVLGLLLPLAALGQRMGFKRIYVGGMAVLLLGSFVSALAPTLGLLALGRVIQGIGGAGIMGVNTALLRQISPPGGLGKALTTNSTATALSMTLAPSIAAAMLSLGSWRWIFVFNLPLAIAALWWARRALPSENGTGNANAAADAFAWRDAVLNVVAFSALFVAARLAPSIESLALLAAGVMVGAFYLRAQRALADPMFPIDLFRSRMFTLSLASAVTAFGSQMLGTVALPFLLNRVLAQPVLIGVVMTAFPAGVLASTLLLRVLINRVSSGTLGAAGMLMMAVGMVLLVTNGASDSVFQWVWRNALCGVGFGLFQAPNNHAILSAAPVSRSGSASGMMGTARLVGQAAAAVVAALIFSALPAGLQATRGVFLCLALGAVLALVAAGFSSLRLKVPARTG